MRKTEVEAAKGSVVGTKATETSAVAWEAEKGKVVKAAAAVVEGMEAAEAAEAGMEAAVVEGMEAA